MADENYQRSFSFSGLDGLQTARHLVQLIVFSVLNGKLLGLGATAVIVPYLWDIQGPFSTAHAALEALEYSITRGVAPLFVLGIIFLTAVTVGRVFCGWACPLGMVQDFLSYLPVKKEKLSPSTTNSLKDVKKVVVAFFALASLLIAYRRSTIQLESPAGVFSDSPYSVLDPSSTLFTYVPWMILWKNNVLISAGSVGWVKLALMVGLLAPSIYIPRFFCRFICPLSALLEPLSKYKALRIYRQGKSLREELNRVLSDVCPMGVQVQSEESDFIDHPGCINCGKCVTELPKNLEQKWG